MGAACALAARARDGAGGQPRRQGDRAASQNLAACERGPITLRRGRGHTIGRLPVGAAGLFGISPERHFRRRFRQCCQCQSRRFCQSRQKGGAVADWRLRPGFPGLSAPLCPLSS
ncbi:MAG: hypothetical protein M3170_00890 [Candidatus Dormibacteraeota bacterium]|nr:hypothetical protein [Candidatus Dormibacteraeota bacterium]